MYAVLIVLIALAYLAVGGFAAGCMGYDPEIHPTATYVCVVLFWPIISGLALCALALRCVTRPFYCLGEWMECNLWFAIRKLKRRK